MLMSSTTEILDALLYSSYEANREKAPHIPAEKWRSLYPEQETYELIYKRKQHEHSSNN